MDSTNQITKLETIQPPKAKDKRRAGVIQKDKAKQHAEEKYKQSIQEKAYLLWEADGKPVGKDEYYWSKAKEQIELKKIPTIYKAYHLLEKRVLEPIETWISKQAIFNILEKVGYLGVLFAVIIFILEDEARYNNAVFTAWQTITSAEGQSGSGGRIEALESLNSRPLRFPWILLTETWTGQTREEWFWDGDDVKGKCEEKRLLGRRWERQSLQGVSAPDALLQGVHLCGANLVGADLKGANLTEAHLERTYLWAANLSGAGMKLASLEGANLKEANLNGAFLEEANLQGANLEGASLYNAFLSEAKLKGANIKDANLSVDLGVKQALTRKQIKSTCNWDKAFYRKNYDYDKRRWIVDKQANDQFIRELKKEPDQEVDCSRWKDKEGRQ